MLHRHHFYIESDGSKLRLIVDGIEKNAVDFSGSFPSSDKAMNIGLQLDGSMDEIRFRDISGFTGVPTQRYNSENNTFSFNENYNIGTDNIYGTEDDYWYNIMSVNTGDAIYNNNTNQWEFEYQYFNNNFIFSYQELSIIWYFNRFACNF